MKLFLATLLLSVKAVSSEDYFEQPDHLSQSRHRNFLSRFKEKAIGEIKLSNVAYKANSAGNDIIEVDKSGVTMPLHKLDRISIQVDASGRTLHFDRGSKFSTIRHATSIEQKGDIEVNSFHSENDKGAVNLIETKHTDGKTCMTAAIMDNEKETVCHLSCDSNEKEVMSCKPTKVFDHMAHADTIIPSKALTRGMKSISKARADDKRGLVDDGSVLDIMVVWTKRSECLNAKQKPGCNLTDKTKDSMMDLIKLAVSQANTAYRLSEVHTQLRLVHAYRHPDYVENANAMHGKLLNHLAFKDGKMDDVHDLREQYKADLVAIIYDDLVEDWQSYSKTCGVAFGEPTPQKDIMFSATQWDCATDGYVFAHEVNHNLGCFHDKGTGNYCNKAGYNFGYRNPEAKFYTIGAYSCQMNQCDRMPKNHCPVIQRISNPNVKYMGDATGTATANCARIINENRQTIAAFYKSNQQNPVAPPLTNPVVPPPTKPAVPKPTVPKPVVPPPTPPPVPESNWGDDWTNDWSDWY